MTGYSDEQLQWTHRNRQPRSRAVRIGELAQEFRRSSRMNGPAWRRKLMGLLQEVLGEDFSLIAGAQLRDGVLKLEIVQAARIYGLRLKWEQRLLQQLSEQLPASGINAIRFVADESR